MNETQLIVSQALQEVCNLPPSAFKVTEARTVEFTFNSSTYVILASGRVV